MQYNGNIDFSLVYEYQTGNYLNISTIKNKDIILNLIEELNELEWK